MASKRISNIEVAGIATVVLSVAVCSPSSCCPLGERGRQDEQITGDSMKAGLAPLLSRSRLTASLAGFFDLSHAFDGPLR